MTGRPHLRHGGLAAPSCKSMRSSPTTVMHSINPERGLEHIRIQDVAAGDPNSCRGPASRTLRLYSASDETTHLFFLSRCETVGSGRAKRVISGRHCRGPWAARPPGRSLPGLDDVRPGAGGELREHLRQQPTTAHGDDLIPDGGVRLGGLRWAVLADGVDEEALAGDAGGAPIDDDAVGRRASRAQLEASLAL